MQKSGGGNIAKLLRYFLVQSIVGFTLTGIILVSVFYITATQLKQDIRRRAVDIAILATERIDIGAHEQIVSSEQISTDLYYDQAHRLAMVAASNPEVSSIYTLRRTNDPEILKFVIDSGNIADLNERIVIEENDDGAAINEPYDISQAPEMAEGLSYPIADKKMTEDKWGRWISGYSPIFNELGESIGVLGVDISTQNYWDRLTELLQRMAIAFVLGALLSFLVGFTGVYMFRRENALIMSQLEQRDVMISSSPLGIAVIDSDKKMYDANPNFFHLLELDGALFRPGTPFANLPKATLANIAPVVTQASPTPGARDEFTTSSKSERRLRVFAITLSEAATNPPILIIIQDITAEYQLTQMLLKRSKTAEAKVAELNKLRKEFVHVVSHQLRTPLNAVRWNIETLLTGQPGKLTKLQKQLLQMTHTAEVEVIKRIGDMLVAMDIEEGKMHIKRQPTSILDIFQEQVISAKTLAKIRKIRIMTSVPRVDIAPLKIDADKIRMAMQQLIDNAITYSLDDTTIHVKLSQPNKKFVRFEVQDQGIGIPKKDQKRIFSRFFRASNASKMKTDSSGLGLALANFIIREHGGKIGFTSKQDKGSTFWFELPIRK